MKIISANWIVTCDENSSIIENGAVVFDDKIIEEVIEVKEVIKKKWYEKKPVIASFFGTIGYTLLQSKDAIIDYLKALDFKYYLIALCIFSLIAYYGLFKQPKPLEEDKKEG